MSQNHNFQQCYVKPWLVLFLDEWVVYHVWKALYKHSGWSREARITILLMNWPILTFTKCCAILEISWAAILEVWMVLWSIYTKLQGPAKHWCCGLQVKITSCVMHEELFSKAEKEYLSGTTAFHFLCHFFLKLLSG